MRSDDTAIGGSHSRFPTTQWTLILSAKDPAAEREALGALMSTYWKPLYVFARRKGLSSEAAKDAVQGLFTQLFEREFLSRLDPARGRLRSFLRTAMIRYLQHQHEKQEAAKRGGNAVHLPFDFEVAESELAQAPEDPERAYEREWALRVMEQALARLEQEFASGRRGGPFAAVVEFFRFDASPSYAEVAAAHGMTIPQLKAFLHRARKRFRELVEEIVAPTVDGDAAQEASTLIASLEP